MNRRTLLLIALSAGILTSCSVTKQGLDPLTKTLKTMEYAVAVPAPRNLDLGNVYRKRDLRQPVLRLTDAMGEAEVRALMASVRNPVSVRDFSQSKTYNLDVNADVIGKVQATLQANGGRSFSVRFGDVKEYQLTELAWLEKVHPALVARLGSGADRLLGAHTIVSLLEVGSLEYTFFKESGGKLELAPGSELVKEITGTLGAGWETKADGSLSIKDKRFLGFRMGEITKDSVPSIGPMVMAPPEKVTKLSRNESAAFLR